MKIVNEKATSLHEFFGMTGKRAARIHALAYAFIAVTVILGRKDKSKNKKTLTFSWMEENLTDDNEKMLFLLLASELVGGASTEGIMGDPTETNRRLGNIIDEIENKLGREPLYNEVEVCANLIMQHFPDEENCVDAEIVEVTEDNKANVNGD